MTSATDLLAIWDSGQGLPPLRRAQMLACVGGQAAANGEEPTIGAANAHMLALRRALFGSQLVGRAACPSCGADLEIDARVEDFLAAADRMAGAPGHEIEIAGQVIEFRLPTLEDLAAIGAAEPPHAAARQLLCACLAEPRDVALDHVLDVAGEAVLERMAALDPLADAMLQLSCEDCGSRFDQAFDIASFLWREIETWAARTLADVHTIARDYGWSENDILAMSPARRQAYLDLIGT